MAKQTTKATEKKEFAWDTETVIKEIKVSDKEIHKIAICTLNGKTFMVDTKIVEFKDHVWKPVKNTTMEMGLFDQVVDAVAEHKLNSAFAGSGIEITEKPAKKKAEKKASEAGTLKGKKAEAPKAEKKPRATKAK